MLAAPVKSVQANVGFDIAGTSVFWTAIVWSVSVLWPSGSVGVDARRPSDLAGRLRDAVVHVDAAAEVEDAHEDEEEHRDREGELDESLAARPGSDRCRMTLIPVSRSQS